MSKIKKVLNENRVLLVLGIILLVCLAIICIVAIKSFYNGSDDVYGNRLDITKQVPLNETVLKDIKSALEANEKVTSATVDKKGKIIYITIAYVDGTSMDDAKVVADLALPILSEEQLKVYDLEFVIKANIDTGNYILTGARNHNGSGTIVWSNYNIPEPSDEGSNE